MKLTQSRCKVTRPRGIADVPRSFSFSRRTNLGAFVRCSSARRSSEAPNINSACNFLRLCVRRIENILAFCGTRLHTHIPRLCLVCSARKKEEHLDECPACFNRQEQFTAHHHLLNGSKTFIVDSTTSSHWLNKSAKLD